MKNKDFVDLIINQMKSMNVDEVPPRRFILATGRMYAKDLIAQKLLDRSLFREANIYSSIECIELEKSDTIRCPLLFLRRCGILMKSVKPLPDLIFSRLGASVRNIRSVDGGYEFSIGYEHQIRNNKKRKYVYKNELFIYIGTDNHIYIPDHEIEYLSLDLITLETEKCECEENCNSGWEYEFIVPDRLLKSVIDQTVSKALLYKQLPEDQNPNLVNGN